MLVLLALLVYGVIGIRATPFIDPRGVYVAPTGAVFVADTSNNRVVLVHKDGFRRDDRNRHQVAGGRGRRR